MFISGWDVPLRIFCAKCLRHFLVFSLRLYSLSLHSLSVEVGAEIQIVWDHLKHLLRCVSFCSERHHGQSRGDADRRVEHISWSVSFTDLLEQIERELCVCCRHALHFHKLSKKERCIITITNKVTIIPNTSFHFLCEQHHMFVKETWMLDVSYGIRFVTSEQYFSSL